MLLDRLDTRWLHMPRMWLVKIHVLNQRNSLTRRRSKVWPTDHEDLGSGCSKHPWIPFGDVNTLDFRGNRCFLAHSVSAYACLSQELIHRDCSFPSRIDRLEDTGRAQDSIPTGEHASHRCLQTKWVSFDGVPSVDSNLSG